MIVHKTHITYPFSAAKMERIKSLFTAAIGRSPPCRVMALAAAPIRLETFEATSPARARYQFMLDNAEYFVRTFIRGPVCRGQIATDG